MAAPSEQLAANGPTLEQEANTGAPVAGEVAQATAALRDTIAER